MQYCRFEIQSKSLMKNNDQQIFSVHGVKKKNIVNSTENAIIWASDHYHHYF